MVLTEKRNWNVLHDIVVLQITLLLLPQEISFHT